MDVVFLLVVLLSEVLGTVGGFGSSVFVVSLGQWLLPLQLVLALTGVLHVFSNTFKLLLFRQGIDWRLLLWIGLPSFAFAVLGAWFSRQFASALAEVVLAVFMVVIASLLLWRPGLVLPPRRDVSVGMGALAGLLAGWIGTGGAVRGLALAAFNLEKSAFVATSAAIDFAVDASRSAVYLQGGYLSRSYWWMIPFLAVAAWLGSWAGKWLLVRVPQARFRTLVLALIWLIGATTLLRTALFS